MSFTPPFFADCFFFNLNVYSMYKFQCQAQGNVLARSTNCSKTIGGSEIPGCTCQTASMQATSRSYSWGNGWAAGLGVRWSGVCHLFTYCGPLSPHMTHVMSLQTITPNSPSEVCYITPRRGCRCNDLDSPGCCWVLKHIHTDTFSQTQGATGLRITHICTHANKYMLYYNSLYFKCLHVYSAGGVCANACWRKTTCLNEFLHVYTIYEHVCDCVVQYFILTQGLWVCGCVTNFISEGDICYTKILPKSRGIKPQGSFARYCTWLWFKIVLLSWVLSHIYWICGRSVIKD